MYCRNLFCVATTFILLACSYLPAAETIASYRFEKDLNGWEVSYGKAEHKHAKDGCKNNPGSIQIIDTSSAESLGIISPKIPLNGAKFLKLTAWTKITDGIGGGIRTVAFDKNNKEVKSWGGHASFSSKRKDMAWDMIQANIQIEDDNAAYIRILAQA